MPQNMRETLLARGPVSAQLAAIADDVDAIMGDVPGAVSTWLTAHPEATTTVQDGAVTEPKLSFLTAGNQNLYDPAKGTDSKRLTASDTLINDATASISDYIPVTSGDVIEFFYQADGLFGKIYRINQYTSAKAYSSTLYGGSPTVKNIVVTAAANGYIRFDCLLAHKSKWQVALRSVRNGFHPFEYNFANNIRFADGTVTPEKTTFVEHSENLIHASMANASYYLAPSTGEWIWNASYQVLDKIPVTAGTTCYYTGFNASGAVAYGLRYASFYDADKVFMSGVSIDYSSDPIKRVVPVPAGAAFVSLTALATNVQHVLSVSDDVVRFIDYYTIKPENLPQIPGDNFDDASIPISKLQGFGGGLAGKTVLGFGTSIMAGAGNNSNGIPELLADAYGMIGVNVSVGGAEVKQSATNNIMAQIDASIVAEYAPDYILFDGGVNDANNTVGEISSGYSAMLDTTTFCGSFEAICKKLITESPYIGKKLIYVTTHRMSTRDYRVTDLYALARQMCQKWSIPVADMHFEGGLNTNLPEHTALYGANGTDPTHPNGLGYTTWYIPRIAAKMREMTM